MRTAPILLTLGLTLSRAFAQDVETVPPPPQAPAIVPAPAPAQAPAPAPPVATPPAPAPEPTQLSTTAAPPAARKPKPAVSPGLPPAPQTPPTLPPAPGYHPAREPGVLDAVIRLGRDIELPAGRAVSGPVAAFGGSVTADCEIDGPVLALGGAVKLGPAARVDGPVVAVGGGVTLHPESKVNGPVVDLPGARVAAKALAALVTLFATLAGLAVFGKLLAGAGWLVVGAILWAMFPDALRNTRTALERQLPACVAWGVVAWPALLVIGATFLISILGLPLVPLVALLAAAAYAWGRVAVAFWIGNYLGRGRWESSLASIVLGLVLLQVVSFIPFVRWLATLAIAVLAAGAAFASRFGLRKPEQIAPAVPE